MIDIHSLKVSLNFSLLYRHKPQMRKLLFLLIILTLAGCTGKEKVPDSYFTPEKAAEYFRDIEEICNRDNGQLWGGNLYAPIMFVERTSRKITTNYPDPEGLLRGRDGIYTGIFPRERIILMAPVNFGGTTYAMVPLPESEDEYRIKTRAVHSLFHVYQQNLGIQPAFFNLMNMDDKEARLFLKLEWKALRKALENEGDERLVAIRDALVFRGAGRELYQKYAGESIQFENYEGLATLTFTRLCSESSEDYKKNLFDYFDRIYNMPSYARTYGNIHGALYASLLIDKGFDLKSISSDTIDLGLLVKNMYDVELPGICRDVAGSLAFGYDYDVITREEEERLTAIHDRLHRMTSTFTEKAVVYMELESPYFDFEPENIHPADTLGTMYSALRVSDNWGKLTVDEGGCLVSGNYKYLRISAKGFKADRNRISGDGWNLILNDGWELIKVDQNHFLRKMVPL